MQDICSELLYINDDVKEIKRLIEAGIDVNAKLTDEMTPLILASVHNSKKIADLGRGC